MEPVRHPIHRRFEAEDLVRLRRSSERRRYAASQRRGRIDPNPHQIEAVMFALRRIPEGGCILADEVGLGKTIEAGLIVAQMMAEGAERILIVVPKPLLGQWQDELYTLFGITAREAADSECDVTAPGVFLAGREYAGSATGSGRLAAAPPFDLCVIDEAHEIFAGIYQRFDRYGTYDETSAAAQTAHRVRKLIRPAPVLLLTATPIQNSLAELWGLLHYVEPTGTLVGTLPIFKALFCEGQDGRRLVPAQAPELRRRLGAVVQRDAAPPGAGVPGQAVRGTSRPTLRIRHEHRGEAALRRRDQLPPVPEPECVSGPFPTTAAHRVPPPHGVLHGGAGEQSGTGRRPAAEDAPRCARNRGFPGPRTAHHRSR